MIVGRIFERYSPLVVIQECVVEDVDPTRPKNGDSPIYIVLYSVVIDIGSAQPYDADPIAGIPDCTVVYQAVVRPVEIQTIIVVMYLCSLDYGILSVYPDAPTVFIYLSISSIAYFTIFDP